MSKVLEESPLQAGREALTRHAWYEAFDLLTEADGLGLLDASDLEGLAEAAWWTGRLDQCIASRERAYTLHLEQGHPRRAALVAIWLAMDSYQKLAHSIGEGWYSRAVRLLKDEGDCVEQGYLAVISGLIASEMGDFATTLSSGEAALDIGTRFGDRDLQAFGLMLQGRALVAKGAVKEGLSFLDEATVAAVSGEIGPFASGVIYCVAIGSTATLADYERAGQWTEASRRWCERQSISGFPGVCRVHRAEIMRLRGSWAEAESEARRALGELQNFNLEFAAEGFYEIGEIRLRMGDLEEARNAFQQAHQLGRDPQPGLALMQLAEGKASVAVASLQNALEDDHLEALRRCRLLTPLVTAALAMGDADTARSAAAEATDIATRFGSPVLQACALLAEAELALHEGDAKVALQKSRNAWRRWKAADLPYEAARARMVIGIALRSSGDEDSALLELRAARSTFDELGAVLDLRGVLDLMGEEVAADLPKAAAPGTRVDRTFMFTDIVNSTNLVEAIGDEAWESVLAWHDQELRKLLENHNGEVVKQTGDGFFAAFEQPAEAVECAVQIQQNLAAHRRTNGYPARVRIGLHTVEATRKGRDYAGRGVHVAARVGALADAGEVIASRQTIEAARPRFKRSEYRSVQVKGVTDLLDVASIDPAT